MNSRNVDYDNGYLRKYLFLDDNCVLVMFPFLPPGFGYLP